MVRSFVNSVNGTLGANYENSLDQVNQPGKGPGGSDGYYIAPASGSMDCPTLKENFEKLVSQINYWYGILQTPGNSNKETENLNKIINVQRSKKDYYSTVIMNNCTVVPELPIPADPGQVDPGTIDLPRETGESNNGIMTWVTSNPYLAAGLAIGAILLISNLSKKKTVRYRYIKKRKKAA